MLRGGQANKRESGQARPLTRKICELILIFIRKGRSLTLSVAFGPVVRLAEHLAIAYIGGPAF